MIGDTRSTSAVRFSAGAFAKAFAFAFNFNKANA